VVRTCGHRGAGRSGHARAFPAFRPARFPDPLLGRIALVGMATLYVMQALLQRRPRWLAAWRRWSYAGFYLDETYTRLTLLVWPTRWTPAKDAGAQPVDLFAPGRNS